MFRVFCRYCEKTDSDCLICCMLSYSTCMGPDRWVANEKGPDAPLHFGKWVPRLEDLPSSEQEDIFMCVMLKEIA